MPGASLEWLASIRYDWLTPAFKFLTILGAEPFFLAFLPFGYWCWRKSAFGRFGVLLLANALLNSYLKELWQAPRPDQAYWLIETGGWSFPSGHAQTAAAAWAWLAYEIRRPWAYAGAAVLIVGICFSRVYLGVHYPVDVIAGGAVGLGFALLFGLAYRLQPEIWRTLRPHLKIGLVIGLTLVWLELFPADPSRAAWIIAGALAGFAAALILEPRLTGFVEAASGGDTMRKLALGVGGLLALHPGLDMALDELGVKSAPVYFLHYLVIGLWVGWFAPALFVRFGWSRQGALGKPAPNA